MRTTFHPTKLLLVDTAAALMDSKAPEDISVDEVLQISGVSKGSMYHHFEDLSELIEYAQISRYSHWVDVSIKNMAEVVRSSKTKSDLLAALKIVTQNTQSDKRKASRIERAAALSRRNASSRYKELLGHESDRLADGIADLAREAQEKELFTRNLNPYAIALLVQAYTLSKIVDDYSFKPVPQEEGNEIIYAIIERVFMAD